MATNRTGTFAAIDAAAATVNSTRTATCTSRDMGASFRAVRLVSEERRSAQEQGKEPTSNKPQKRFH